MDEFSSNIGVRKSFLTVAQNPDVVKEKIDTFDYIKLITFTRTLLAGQTNKYTCKRPHLEHNQNTTDKVGENICKILQI